MREECAGRPVCRLRLQQASDQLMAGQAVVAYGTALEILHEAGGCSGCDAAADCWAEALALAKGALLRAQGATALAS